MKVLMVSWEYPPVVVGGLGRHVYQLATALAADGHEVVVLSRRPTGTDPSTHPSTDEDAEGVRVVAAAQDPARVRLQHRHDGVDPGDGAFDGPLGSWTEDPRTAVDQAVASRRRARARLAGRPPGHRAGRTLRRTPGFHDPCHRGGQALRLGGRPDQQAGARRRGLAGSRIRFAHHVFGVHGRRDHRIVRAGPCRDTGHPQRHRRRPVAVREAQASPRSASAAVPGTAGVREGCARR